MPFNYDPYTGEPLSQRSSYPWGWNPPKPPQQIPQASPQEPSTPWTMVPSLADVDKVGVQPGETKWIMIQSDPIFAVKTANAMGYAPAEYYRFEQIDPMTLAQPMAVSPLTRQDVESIVDAKAAELIKQYAAMIPTPSNQQAAVPAKAKKEASV